MCCYWNSDLSNKIIFAGEIPRIKVQFVVEIPLISELKQDIK